MARLGPIVRSCRPSRCFAGGVRCRSRYAGCLLHDTAVSATGMLGMIMRGEVLTGLRSSRGSRSDADRVGIGMVENRRFTVRVYSRGILDSPTVI